MIDDRLTFKAVKEALSLLNMRIDNQPGEYRINFKGGREATAYFTDDLQDALNTGRAMAEHAPPSPLPPLGPMGRRFSRKGQMYRHNRKLAAKRKRQAAEAASHGPHPSYFDGPRM